jgi:hypothetical protein
MNPIPFARCALAIPAAVFLTFAPAHAALHDRGNGFLYEDVLNITILKDANFAQTSGFDADGRMTWETANTWVQSLNMGGASGWRLPHALPLNGAGYSTLFSTNGSTDYGYNISAPGSVFAGSTKSELAYLFFNSLGNIAEFTLSGAPSPCRNVQIGVGNCLENVGPFVNLQSYTYWSGNPSPEAGSYFAFTMDGGFQSMSGGNNSLYALAIHDGDVAPVPELPATVLLCSGLALLCARSASLKRKER